MENMRRLLKMQTSKWIGVFALLHVVSIFLFIKGFLLTRFELPNVSACDMGDDQIGRNVSGCWSDARYDKVVMVVLDALRYDFVVEDGNMPGAMHVEQLPKLLALREEAKESAALMKFIADPPTNTLQRLKGMLMGSLPTFLDVGTTFAAAALTEDNLLLQVKKKGGKVAVIGDDTWDQLFPEFFDISHTFPSFNVRDLHTVDDGVWKHLLPLAVNATDDWDFLIAHYLGVDHAGHAFSVGTQQMLQKLHQMDDQITLAIETLIKEAQPGGPLARTLVLVLGDHGQTLHGDHGGGTWEETDSALLAFDVGSIHKSRKAKENNMDNICSIDGPSKEKMQGSCVDEEVCPLVMDLDQLDFASSLAIMMGLPIPFGNVGKISKTLWTFAFGESEEKLLQALRMNAAQVHKYLQLYSQKAGIDGSAMAHLKAKYVELEEQQDTAATEDYMQYLDMAAQLARRQWTQFNNIPIVCGLVLLGIVLTVHAHLFWSRLGVRKGRSLVETFLWLIWFIHGLSLLSNSYIMAEGRMLGFWIASIVILMTCACFMEDSQKAQCMNTREKKAQGLKEVRKAKILWNRINNSKKALLCGTGVLLLNVILEKVGLIDRTGGNPFDKTSLQPAGAQIAGPVEQMLVHIPLLLMPAVLTFGRFLRKPKFHTMRSKFDQIILFGQIVIWLEFALVSMYWLLQSSTPELDQLLSHSPVGDFQEGDNKGLQIIFDLSLNLLLPRLVYALSMVCVVTLSIGCVLVRSRLTSSIQDFNLLQDFHQAVVGCILAPVVLLLGTIGPLLGVLGVLEILCFLKLAVYLSCSPQFVTGMLGLFAGQLFFFTGHFCEFSGLQFVSVFTGFDDFEFYRSGFLLAVNTFSSIGLCCTAITISSTVFCKNYTLCNSEVGSSVSRKEVNGNNSSHGVQRVMMNRSDILWVSLSIFQFLHAFKTFWSMLCAAIQRRHLMIWAIFAPKFAFEVAFLLIVDVVALLIACVEYAISRV